MAVVSHSVAPGVHRLGSTLVNFYVVEDGGRLTVVDGGLRGYAPDLESDLAALGHGIGSVDAVVLTHSDADHTGVVPRLREAGARVLIHRADGATLAKPGPKSGDASPIHLLPQLRRPQLWRFAIHFARNGAMPSKIEGAETFGGDDVLDVPGSPRVIATPGHTPGHCVLLFGDVLFAGDALCTLDPVTGQRGPRLMPRAMNVDNDQALESLGAIEHVEAAWVLPGHGEPWPGGAEAVALARAALTAR